jgi:hypothetical protein
MPRLGEARGFVTEALRVANDVEQVASPELHAGLAHIRDLLGSAVEAMEPDPIWPGLAARA